MVFIRAGGSSAPFDRDLPPFSLTVLPGHLRSVILGCTYLRSPPTAFVGFSLPAPPLSCWCPPGGERHPPPSSCHITLCTPSQGEPIHNVTDHARGFCDHPCAGDSPVFNPSPSSDLTSVASHLLPKCVPAGMWKQEMGPLLRQTLNSPPPSDTKT